jgi:hypothetical protein
MFEILHFRGSDKILKEKNMLRDVQATMQYIDDVLAGVLHKRDPNLLNTPRALQVFPKITICGDCTLKPKLIFVNLVIHKAEVKFFCRL